MCACLAVDQAMNWLHAFAGFYVARGLAFTSAEFSEQVLSLFCDCTHAGTIADVSICTLLKHMADV